ncbi:6937_t:CDS:1, partial [Racocetra persica]
PLFKKKKQSIKRSVIQRPQIKEMVVVYHRVPEAVQNKFINNKETMLQKGQAIFEKKQTLEAAKFKQYEIPVTVKIDSMGKNGVQDICYKCIPEKQYEIPVTVKIGSMDKNGIQDIYYKYILEKRKFGEKFDICYKCKLKKRKINES